MKGQKVGYVRVSSVEQNTGRQLEGIEVDRIFVDRASGKNTDRPKFQEMLNYVREGDRVIVHSMDRFARSLKDLVTEVDKLVKRGIAIQFVKENITFTAQSTPMDNLMLQLMGAFAQFEREIILERQKEGIKLASSQGKYKGRIQDIEGKLGAAQVIDVKELEQNGRVVFGVTVTIENLDTEEQKTYKIVGDDEADFKINKISVNSPIARGLLGKNEGDDVKINTPNGEVEYEIVKVVYL